MTKPKNCIKPVFDTCVIWTSDSMPFFGIEYGQSYDITTVLLAKKLQEYATKQVHLKCLYDNTCGQCQELIEIPEAVQIIVDKLCSLTSSDIQNVGDLSCLGTNTLSPDAAKLINRPLKLVTTPNTSGATVTYDYSEAIKNLPTGFSLGQIRTKVSGTMKNGSSVISDSDKSFLVSNVKSDRFPLSVSTEVNINTPSGTVKLSKGVTIGGTEANDHSTTFELTDFSSLGTSQFTQTDVNELVTAELCEQRSELDQLKNIDVTDYPGCVVFPSHDIKDVVAALAGAVAALCDRVTKLEHCNVKHSGPCGDVSQDQTPEEAIQTEADTNASQDQAILDLQTNIENLNTALNAFTSTQSGLLPGGFPGNCPGGNCS